VSDVLVRRKKEIAESVHGLCAAISNLSEIRHDLDRTSRGIGVDGLLAIKVKRIQGYLMSAAIDIPDEMWRIMLNTPNVGGEELHARVYSALGMIQIPASADVTEGVPS